MAKLFILFYFREEKKLLHNYFLEPNFESVNKKQLIFGGGEGSKQGSKVK